MKNIDKFNKNDSGVSPVIGVILMVAATIVIAGVIMAMLGGFAPVEPTRTVSVTASHTAPNNVTVVFHGGPDGRLVQNINATIDGDCFGGNITAVGDSITTPNADVGPGNDHIVAVARFDDGTYQVVLDVIV